MRLPALISTDGKIDKNKAIALFGSLLLCVLLLLSANKKPKGLLANGNVIAVISGAVITSLGLLSHKKFDKPSDPPSEPLKALKKPKKTRLKRTRKTKGLKNENN